MSASDGAAVDDLVVVGAGLVGLSCALAGLERGMTVRVVEAGVPARQASAASAGGVRSLNRHPAEIALVRAALPLWARLGKKLGRGCGFRASGQVRVAEDAAALGALERREAMVRELGHRHERLLGRAELRRRVPAIAPHALGGLGVDDDGFADPLATAHALRGAVVGLGGRIVEATRVDAIEAGGDRIDVLATGPAGPVECRARRCVNAAGAWGGALAARAGDAVPIRTAALQMSVTAPVAHFLDPVIGSEGRKLSLKQTDAGALVIGGGHEGVVIDRDAGDGAGDGAGGGTDDATGGGSRAACGRVLRARLAENLAAATSLFPALAEARVVRTWAGLEGMVADGLPVIGRSAARPALVHAFGFCAHGFALVPLVGTLVADLVEGRVPAHDLGPFDPARFAAADLAPADAPTPPTTEERAA